MRTENNLPKAEECLTKTVSILMRLLGDEIVKILLACTQLGEVFYLQGKLNDASVLLEKVLCIESKTIENFLSAYCAEILGSVYYRQGRLFEAEKMHSKSYEIYLKQHGEKHSHSKP